MNEVPFEVVKCYQYSRFEGWTTEDRKGDLIRDEAYFMKIEGEYFWIGQPDHGHYMVENEIHNLW